MEEAIEERKEKGEGGREGGTDEQKEGRSKTCSLRDTHMRNKLGSIISVSCKKVETRQKSRTEGPSWVHPVSDGSGSPTYP